MKLVSLTLAFVLAASQAPACIPVTTSDGLVMRINVGGNIAEFRYSDLRRGSEELRSEQLREALQAHMDNRIPRLSLDMDDPDRSENFDTNNNYWSNADGNPIDSIFDATHVTFRCVLASDVHWNGVDFIVTWTTVQ